MTYIVTANRVVFIDNGPWQRTSQIPSFTVEALNEDNAKSIAKDIIGPDLYAPSLSVAAI